MPAIKKTNKEIKLNDVIVSDKVKSYENEPFFIEKAEKAKAFLQKNPLPNHLRK